MREHTKQFVIGIALGLMLYGLLESLLSADTDWICPYQGVRA